MVIFEDPRYSLSCSSLSAHLSPEGLNDPLRFKLCDATHQPITSHLRISASSQDYQKFSRLTHDIDKNFREVRRMHNRKCSDSQ